MGVVILLSPSVGSVGFTTGHIRGGPIANPGEMASSHALSVHILQSIPGMLKNLRKYLNLTRLISIKSLKQSQLLKKHLLLQIHVLTSISKAIKKPLQVKS